MNKIFIMSILLTLIYTYRLRSSNSLHEISDNSLVAIYHRKEKLYISSDGSGVTTSQSLRANEQFMLVKRPLKNLELIL